MPDLNKLFEKAEKNLQKQKFDSALDAYLEIYKYAPNDEEVLVKLGDLSLKLNRTADGLRFQSQLVDHYSKRNDIPKAVAMCRKILKVSAHDVGTLTKLASLLEKSKKNNEALEAYREALKLHLKAAATQQAIDCLEHMVKLDPESLDAHVQLGELASKAGQIKIATPSYLHAAQLARKAGQENRWAELVERAHSLDPAEEAACIAAAEVYLNKDRPAEAIPLLEPVSRSKAEDPTVTELLARAYLRTGNHEKGEPLCWKLYQARPEAIDFLVELAEGLLKAGLTEKALGVIEKMKAQLIKQGHQNELLRIVEKAYAVDETNVMVLERLVSLYDELNKDDGLRRSLTRLFNLFLAGENYPKAGETLERIIDVDPYGQGHHDRLLNLEGHIDPTWYQGILSRVETPSAGRAVPGAPTGARAAGGQEAESLDDLIIEGEMYHQYQLAPKLTETLKKINQLFPGAEERNARLFELYGAAGFTPVKPAPAVGAASRAGPGGAPVTSSPQSLEDLKNISEITANIYREPTPQGVIQVAVNEVVRALKPSRCWGALGTADRPPAFTVESCSPASAPSDASAALKVYGVLIHQAATKPDGWAVEDVKQSSILAPVLREVQELRVKSLLALPLMDQDEPTGLLIVEQCERPRTWTAGERLLLKAIATQVIIAVNNTKLRRLVQSLAGSDEETGLLPRSSYLDCLLAESSRAKGMSQPVSVCLLEPDNPTALVKALGEAGMQQYFQQVSKLLRSNLRQNDIAIRYSPFAIAVVFPDTPVPQGGVVLEKLRRAMSQIKVDGAAAPNFCAAICDVQLGRHFDTVDGVTEVINRLEAALDQARKEGGKGVLVSKFEG